MKVKDFSLGEKIYEEIKKAGTKGISKKEISEMFDLNIMSVESYMYSKFLIYEEKDSINHTMRYFYAGDTQ